MHDEEDRSSCGSAAASRARRGPDRPCRARSSADCGRSRRPNAEQAGDDEIIEGRLDLDERCRCAARCVRPPRTSTMTPENQQQRRDRPVADQRDQHRDQHRDHEGAGRGEDLEQLRHRRQEIDQEEDDQRPEIDRQPRRAPTAAWLRSVRTVSLMPPPPRSPAPPRARRTGADRPSPRRRRWRGSAGRTVPPRRPARRRARCRRAWS